MAVVSTRNTGVQRRMGGGGGTDVVVVVLVKHAKLLVAFLKFVAGELQRGDKR